MYCVHCGKQTPQNSTFCLHCGKLIWQNTQNNQTTPALASVPLPIKKPSSGIVTGVVVCCIVLGLALFIGIVAYNQQGKNSSSYSPSSSSQSYSSSRTIVKDSFAVGARMYITYAISGGGTVVGDFKAKGGANDINVMILDDTGFQNFKNGHSARTYYNSGYVTTDRLNVPLDSGTYYLIFDNTKAMLTNKWVTANIRIE